jgi:hypothetical protein
MSPGAALAEQKKLGSTPNRSATLARKAAGCWFAPMSFIRLSTPERKCSGGPE